MPVELRRLFIRFLASSTLRVFIVSVLSLLLSHALIADMNLNQKLEQIYLEPVGAEEYKFLKEIPRQGLISYIYNQNTSSVIFTLNHVGITGVAGKFRDFSGTFQFDPLQIQNSSTQIRIRTGSVDCNNSYWDKKLTGSGYFESDNFPEIKFISREVFDIKKNRFDILGDLTIRDTTKPVVFRVDILGIMKNDKGYEQMGFKAYAIISRQEFSLGLEDFLGKAGLFFKEELKLSLEVKGLPIAAEAHP